MGEPGCDAISPGGTGVVQWTAHRRATRVRPRPGTGSRVNEPVPETAGFAAGRVARDRDVLITGEGSGRYRLMLKCSASSVL